MPKNIVICSDGTGNRGGKTRGTNVWRIFNAVDRHCRDTRQITFYDDGVGTQDWRWFKLFSGAFGLGLKRNIREAYAFLAMNYEPGDRLYLFGFSRGAFTVRSLAGLIHHGGLIRRAAIIKVGSKRRRVLNLILKAYRSTDESEKRKSLEEVETEVAGSNNTCFHECPTPIHFIGVWDTVDAIGMPFDGIMKWLDGARRCLCKRRLWNIRDRRLGPHVHYAYQALALDDERKTFHPIIWNHPNNSPGVPSAVDCSTKCEATGTGPTIEQVWFAGMHSNIGGGYPKDAMSLVSLDWMMGKAEACGLRFLNGVRENVQRDADVHGRIYDSRSGWGAIYRYAPRNLYELYEQKAEKEEFLPAIHGSVFQRIQRGTGYYAPKVIRGNEDGKIMAKVAWTNSGPYARPYDWDETDDA